MIDYLNYLNTKHGGVNGVKLVYEECETKYNAARSVECYQRLLHRGDQKMLLWDPYALPDAIGTPSPEAPVVGAELAH